ncbi:murein hydrolase activator EnvC family protein [Terrabacter terrigena]|uniref:Murein hydrolase activator EnvC family protein n=1 Tax=Terrabacter terrigena TaxID=574718 RepID=A0ABW3MRH4_9MICO
MSIGSALLAAVVATASVTTAVAAPPGAMPSGAAPAVARTGSGSHGRWAWPLDPEPSVERRFDPPEQPWLPGHRGVDLAAASGQSVQSPAAGTVTYSGRLAGRGVVVVAHDRGLRSTFEPVDGSVEVGATVARGERVGVVTSTAGHCAPAVCLHWGVLRGQTYLDPLSFVGRARIVLLPL